MLAEEALPEIDDPVTPNPNGTALFAAYPFALTYSTFIKIKNQHF